MNRASANHASTASGRLPREHQQPGHPPVPLERLERWQPRALTTGLHRFRLRLDECDPVLEWSALVLRGAGDGPVFLATAGVHGDEYEGMEGIRTFVAALDPGRLRGTFIGIPVVSESAYDGVSRCAPQDGRDLARSFPGQAGGTVTQRVAHAMRHILLPQCDFYCDLHSAGLHYEIAPLCGYQLGPPEIVARQHSGCVAFGLPLIWATTMLPGRSLTAAREAGVPAMYVEYPGRGGCDPADVEHCRQGLRQVAAWLRMLDEPWPETLNGTFVEDAGAGAGHLQGEGVASASGFFRSQVRVWQRVKPGDPMGDIVDAFGNVLQVLTAERAGRIVMLRRTCRVNRGESCFSIMPGVL